MTHNIINQDPPATCSKEIAKAISKAAGSLQLKTKHMVSRAYHDSLFMARWVVLLLICVAVVRMPSSVH